MSERPERRTTGRALRVVYQIGTFARKEIADVLRQPRLLLTLVLGPFLVLAAFGVGYRNTPKPMKTLFVGPEGSPLLDQVQQYADGLEAFVEFEGISHDPAAARQRLMDGDIDLIVTVPDDPSAEIVNGEQAKITITHTRLDPIERSAISFASRLAVDNINSEVLSRVVAAGQEAGTSLDQDVNGAVELLSETADDSVSQARAQTLSELLASSEQPVDTFLTMDPRLMVQPFESEVDLAVPGANRLTDWYVPAAVVLILQQFGVAFGALSFVRERRLGIVEVFRVAPVGSWAATVGKYVAYLLLGGVVAGALIGLVVAAMNVPVVGGMATVALVVALTLFASVGLGFVISLISATDAQAVQYTMIVLLASLFFSGFFLNVTQMETVARAAGFLLPVTYAMELLRDVMLRGADPDPMLMGGLAIYGVVMFLVTVLGGRRRMGAAA